MYGKEMNLTTYILNEKDTFNKNSAKAYKLQMFTLKKQNIDAEKCCKCYLYTLTNRLQSVPVTKK